MKNIDLFDEYTAKILAQMYQAFPEKTSLNACKLCGHSENNDFGQILDDQGNPSKHFKVAHATIEWLWETGYIRGDGMDVYGINRAVLSPLGLAVLKSVPSSLTVKETTGDRFAKLVKDGAYDSAKDLVKSAIATGAALAVHAATGPQ